MKKLLLSVMVLGVTLSLAGPVHAFQPSGWVYHDYPWAYDSGSGDWHWFDPGDTQWIAHMDSGQWAVLPESALASGWVFHLWPFAYAQGNDAWHWINEPDTQWVVNMRTGQWSRFGDPVADPDPDPDRYLVIDLSAGPSVSSYPVSYMAAAPDGGWTDEYKTTKLVLRRIPAGTFTMGSPEDELGRYSNEAQRQVTLTKDYYIGVFQVTQKQWERVMGDWPSYFENEECRETRPLESRSWHDIRGGVWPGEPSGSGQPTAGTFIERINTLTGLSFDLPTEAQWEYACRAGTTTALNSGKNLTGEGSCPNASELGRYAGNHPGGYSSSRDVSTAGGTAKVGSYLPNAWGLYDMHGNLWEWCLDWYRATPPGTTDPVGAATGSSRVSRGGSWDYYAWYCRSACRFDVTPWHRSSYFGFRLSRTLP